MRREGPRYWSTRTAASPGTLPGLWRRCRRHSIRVGVELERKGIGSPLGPTFARHAGDAVERPYRLGYVARHLGRNVIAVAHGARPGAARRWIWNCRRGRARYLLPIGARIRGREAPLLRRRNPSHTRTPIRQTFRSRACGCLCKGRSGKCHDDDWQCEQKHRIGAERNQPEHITVAHDLPQQRDRTGTAWPRNPAAATCRDSQRGRE